MRLLIAALIACLICGAGAALATGPYEDVPTDHWAYDALDYLTGRGVLEGYPDNFFKGDRTLTRYEFGQAVARLLDSIPQSDSGVQLMAETLRAEFSDQLAELLRGLDGTAASVNALDARIGDLEGAAGENSSQIADLESRMDGFRPGPNWNGEFVYRWESICQQTRVSQPDSRRFRQRIRFRIGYSKQINEAVQMNFRLQTMTGNDETDSFHTLSDRFNSADIFLDQAYIRYSPAWFGFYTRCEDPVDCSGCETSGCPSCTDCTPRLDVYAGIFPNISTDPNEIVLDEDVNLHGAGLVYHFNEEFRIMTAASVAVEVNGLDFDDDTYMFVTELRHDNLFGGSLDAWVGAYSWHKESSLPAAYFAGNRMAAFDFNNDGLIDGNDRFATDFHTLKGGMQYTFDWWWDKPLAVYGEYMVNLDSDAEDRIDAVNPFVVPDIIYESSDDYGWVVGAQYGQVPENCRDWYAFARYKEIGANAIIDGFGDQDAGGANINSLEVHWEYMWADNTLVGVSWFCNKMHNAFGFAIPEGATDERRAQIDWIFRF